MLLFTYPLILEILRRNLENSQQIATSLLYGSNIVNSVPNPNSDVKNNCPPCCVIIWWLIDNPKPVPLPTGFVVKNGFSILS